MSDVDRLYLRGAVPDIITTVSGSIINPREAHETLPEPFCALNVSYFRGSGRM